ncbi:heterokaryon incompatibility protein-domain-containing protein [Phaeosphaeriaceae sp. PMI808]|nr:heterokaryon incompatibility protein-domain-containing protein [Phaeosphaeriaceae sp. PMI808]
MSTLSSKPQPYHLQPLKSREIRLLINTSSHAPQTRNATTGCLHDEPLNFVTRRYKLHETPEFDAISYVWGTASASISVQVNGSPLLVTPSVREMLEHLHLYRPHMGRPIWIDAICIDQENVEEKAIQIPLMCHIYARAAQVVIWMGISNPAIHKFMKEFPNILPLKDIWTPKVRTYDQQWRGEDWPPDDDDFWIGLYHLLSHEWFTRLWTYQEVYFATNPIILCGSTWICAKGFVHFVREGVTAVSGYLPYDPAVASKVSKHRDVPAIQSALTACEAISGAYLSPYGYVSVYDIVYFLTTLQHRYCKEHVDRVWAIVGLLEKKVQEKLSTMVDYTEKGRKEFWKTYIWFAAVVTNVGETLTILETPPSIKRDPNLPSWCPDLSGQFVCMDMLSPIWNNRIQSTGYQSTFLFDTDDHEKTIARRSAIMDHPLKSILIIEQEGILKTRGFVVDSIAEIVEEPRLFGLDATFDYISGEDWTMSNPTHAATVDFYTRALSLARRVLDDHLSDAPLKYVMTMMMDCRVAADTTEVCLDAWAAMSTEKFGHLNSLDEDRTDHAWTMVLYLLSVVGHSFFSTEGGRIGIAHPGCKVGDKICAFYGGEPLYILRWQGSEDLPHTELRNEAAKFCGIAFIPYLMEQHQRDDARSRPEEIFTIK